MFRYNLNRYRVSGRFLTLACLVLISNAGQMLAEDHPPQRIAAVSSQPDPRLTPVVRDVLQHEIKSQNGDKSLWCYRKLLEKDGKRQLFASCQTEAAEINRLMAEDGKPLTAKQWQVGRFTHQKIAEQSLTA